MGLNAGAYEAVAEALADFRVPAASAGVARAA